MFHKLLALWGVKCKAVGDYCTYLLELPGVWQRISRKHEVPYSEVLLTVIGQYNLNMGFGTSLTPGVFSAITRETDARRDHYNKTHVPSSAYLAGDDRVTRLASNELEK